MVLSASDVEQIKKEPFSARLEIVLADSLVLRLLRVLADALVCVSEAGVRKHSPARHELFRSICNACYVEQ